MKNDLRCAEHLPVASLSAAPAPADAPGRGILPDISRHSAMMPTLYDFDAQPIEQISPLVQRQMLNGTRSTIVRGIAKAGGVFPLLNHVNEQITWITKGRCEVYSQGKKFTMTAGTILVIPPNVPLEFVCLEDTIDIDFFSPRRQDWIDGDTVDAKDHWVARPDLDVVCPLNTRLALPAAKSITMTPALVASRPLSEMRRPSAPHRPRCH
jgi:quercetin dioxygenase-like cupin family protein